jgi:hypothetical protein
MHLSKNRTTGKALFSHVMHNAGFGDIIEQF